MRPAAALLAALLFCGPAGARCLLPAQKPMVAVELFFGREIEGRGPVSKTEWSDFASAVIGREFPDGFTATDGEGSWRDPESGAVVHEDSKVVLAVARRSRDLGPRIGRVVAAYRAKFKQQSVGVVTHEVCAAF